MVPMAVEIITSLVWPSTTTRSATLPPWWCPTNGGPLRCRCYNGNTQSDEHSKDFDKKREVDDILGDLMPNNELNLSKKIHDWDVGDEGE